MRSTSVKAGLTVLLSSSLSIAAIVLLPFPEMVSQAKVVVFGEVSSVEEFAGGKRLARVRVLETWRGPESKELTIDIRGYFACDISTAFPGERAIFILESSDVDDHPRLAHYGRGRLPVKDIDGTLYVEGVWSTDLPKWIAFRDLVPERFNEKGRVYALSDLKRYFTR